MNITKLSKELQEEIQDQLGDMKTVEEAAEALIRDADCLSTGMANATNEVWSETLERMEALQALAINLNNETTTHIAEEQALNNRLKALSSTILSTAANVIALLKK